MPWVAPLPISSWKQAALRSAYQEKRPRPKPEALPWVAPLALSAHQAALALHHTKEDGDLMATIRVKPDVSCVVFWRGTQIVLSPGIAFDDAEPFVKEHPSYFEYDLDADTSQRITAVAVGPDAPIEAATARPGEKRSTRRPR